MRIQYEMKTDVSPLYIVASEEGLHGVYFNKQCLPVKKSLAVSLEENVIRKTVSQLEEYFAGRRKQFDFSKKSVGRAI